MSLEIKLIKNYSYLRSIEEQILTNKQSVSAKANSNEITLMVDLDSKDSYMRFLNQFKYLKIMKIKYHFLLVTLVSFFNRLLS